MAAAAWATSSAMMSAAGEVLLPGLASDAGQGGHFELAAEVMLLTTHETGSGAWAWVAVLVTGGASRVAAGDPKFPTPASSTERQTSPASCVAGGTAIPFIPRG